MSLVSCEECGNEISTRAIFCPKCGCPTGGEPTQESSPPEQSGSPVSSEFSQTFPHPGPMPQIGGMWNLQKKFAAMGTIAGRHYDEIVKVVGLPKSRSQQPFGRYLCQWMSLHPMYHIALIFDANGTCGGVTHESR